MIAQDLPTEKKVEDMTEEERNYLYFKVHDLDGNGKLDGLEIFYSATHHSTSEYENEHNHDHEHVENSETNEETETNEDEQNQESIDSNTDLPNLNLLEADENGKLVNNNINHIIG